MIIAEVIFFSASSYKSIKELRLKYYFNTRIYSVEIEKLQCRNIT